MRLPEIFQDHMVLQREKPICVFGQGQGEGSIRFCGETVPFTANGDFRVYLPAREAGGSYDMTIELSGETRVLHDLLLGDVFLAAGQSNMEFALGNHADYQSLLRELPLCRYFREPHSADAALKLRYEDRGWQIFTPREEPSFSAIGYLFAAKLFSETGVPVGIVSCNLGASRVDAWTAPEVTKTPDYQALIRTRHIDYEFYRFNQDNWLYQNKLKHIVPYACRGVLWYQGESNRGPGEAANYAALFQRMLENWRALWADALPFYCVQLMPYNEDAEKADWPAIRACQEKAAKTLPGVRMVTLCDTGESHFIHPPHKQGVAEALAKAALCDMGRPGEYSGPVQDQIRFSDQEIVVTFTHAKGLAIAGDALKDTFVYTKSGQKLPAAGRVCGDTLHLTWEKGAPAALSMGWQNAPEHNLVNAAGYLASPFFARNPA